MSFVHAVYPAIPKQTLGRNRPAPKECSTSSLIVEPSRRPINPSPIPRLVAIRAMIGVVSLLAALDFNHRRLEQKQSTVRRITVP